MVCVWPFTFNVTGIVPGTAGAVGVACSCASALAAGAAIGTIVPAAVATLAAPMCDRNDLLLSLPNEEAGSFLAFSSVVKTFLLITACPVWLIIPYEKAFQQNKKASLIAHGRRGYPDDCN